MTADDLKRLDEIDRNWSDFAEWGDNRWLISQLRAALEREKRLREALLECTNVLGRAFAGCTLHQGVFYVEAGQTYDRCDAALEDKT